jgi:CubicO group peptidase (beta-lactamase class C family)
MFKKISDSAIIQGSISPGFEDVKVAFAENFAKRGEVGAACAVYYRGEKVVDLWGGYRDQKTKSPWEENTLVLVFSTTKGLASMTLALAHSRGLLNYDERVSTYWPEFAQEGKKNITVRQLLSHQAGLCAIDEPLTPDVLADPDARATIIARQRPIWEPGTKHGYHFNTLGLYESELIRRIDPFHRTLGKFFQDEIAKPLGLVFYIGLPPDIPNTRIASMIVFSPLEILLGLSRIPVRVAWALRDSHSLTYRAFYNPNPAEIRPNVEFPSGSGIGLVRSIAKAYGILATGGRDLGITRETIDELTRPAIQPSLGSHDEVLHVETAFSLGYLKPCEALRFGSSSKAFGMNGTGGSVGFADPEPQIGFAYAPNKMIFGFFGDSRAKNLEKAVYKCVERMAA